MENGIEVVFWGTDAGDIELHDDIRDVKMHQNFARSMSLADAMSPDNILCYEMNGADLPAPNGVAAAADRPRLVRHRQRQVAEAHRDPRPALHEPVHGARLRHHPRGGARRRDGLGRDLGRPHPPEVGAVAGHQERRRLPHRGGRLGRADREGGGEDRRRTRGSRRRSTTPRRPNTPGRSGPSIGRPPRRASTRSPPARPTPRGRSSPPWTTPGSRRSTPTGRATARSPGASTFPEGRHRSAGRRRRRGGEARSAAARAPDAEFGFARAADPWHIPRDSYPRGGSADGRQTTTAHPQPRVPAHR